ncbi:hypothetical protein DPMN_043456 [Dreissena polymorpha]|uniref:Uncharacterized protein n=1 Tax=Dreissena polymorpha TaxID=45954 RepID=A0A9D4D2S5_DREPO|nr:hypothetical protein DPMN_043456 [Dreissena polymorpha]
MDAKSIYTPNLSDCLRPRRGHCLGFASLAHTILRGECCVENLVMSTFHISSGASSRPLCCRMLPSSPMYRSIVSYIPSLMAANLASKA